MFQSKYATFEKIPKCKGKASGKNARDEKKKLRKIERAIARKVKYQG